MWGKGGTPKVVPPLLAKGTLGSLAGAVCNPTPASRKVFKIMSKFNAKMRRPRYVPQNDEKCANDEVVERYRKSIGESVLSDHFTTSKKWFS